MKFLKLNKYNIYKKTLWCTNLVFLLKEEQLKLEFLREIFSPFDKIPINVFYNFKKMEVKCRILLKTNGYG